MSTWEMHLYVERKEGSGWQSVCPPLPTSSRSRPKWGSYTPTNPMEAIALEGMSEAERVPGSAARWDFGPHLVGQQQLGMVVVLMEDTLGGQEHPLRNVEPFLDPCGLPTQMSPQVAKVATYLPIGRTVWEQMPSLENAAWFTTRELSQHIRDRRPYPDQIADKRVVALRDELNRLAGVFYPDICKCKINHCYHRDELLRIVFWFAKKEKKNGV
jgi:hypothetical protein